MIDAVPTDKLSATVDARLLAEVREHAGPRGLSAFVAMALQHELERARLRELLDELATELGPPDESMVAAAVAELTELTGGAVPAQRDVRRDRPA